MKTSDLYSKCALEALLDFLDTQNIVSEITLKPKHSGLWHHFCREILSRDADRIASSANPDETATLGASAMSLYCLLMASLSNTQKYNSIQMSLFSKMVS